MSFCKGVEACLSSACSPVGSEVDMLMLGTVHHGEENMNAAEERRVRCPVHVSEPDLVRKESRMFGRRMTPFAP